MEFDPLICYNPLQFNSVQRRRETDHLHIPPSPCYNYEYHAITYHDSGHDLVTVKPVIDKYYQLSEVTDAIQYIKEENDPEKGVISVGRNRA